MESFHQHLEHSYRLTISLEFNNIKLSLFASNKYGRDFSIERLIDIDAVR